jgi:hypothetical protein
VFGDLRQAESAAETVSPGLQVLQRLISPVTAKSIEFVDETAMCNTLQMSLFQRRNAF